MLKKFNLYIRTDNAAFQDGNKGAEIARILRQVADRVENMSEDDLWAYKTIRDLNGNDVGRFAEKENQEQ